MSMKKIPGYLAAAGMLASICVCAVGCTTASAQGEREPGAYVDESIAPKDGYYLSDNDKSYIYVENGYIGLFDYDYEAVAAADWDRECKDWEANKNTSREDWIRDCVETEENITGWADFKPLRVVSSGDSVEDSLMLVVHYRPEKGGCGYGLNEDGTIWKYDNTYTYCGTELPEGYNPPDMDAAWAYDAEMQAKIAAQQ